MKVMAIAALSLSGTLSLAACVGAPGDETDAPGEVGMSAESKALPARAGSAPTGDATDESSSGTDSLLDAPHCWACGNTQACYNSHSINTCFVQCSGSGGQMWDLGEPPYSTCDGYASNFCTFNNLGSVTMRCWGGYY